MKKILLKIIYITIFSIIFLSCGLPSYNIVEPPVLVSSDNTFKSFNAPDDDSNIDGYEILYKIYKVDDASIESDKSKFDLDSSNFTYEFGETKAISLGFKRLVYGTSSTNGTFSYPLISSSSSDVINLQNNENCLISINAGSDRIMVDTDNIGIPLRSVTEGVQNYYKTFENNVVDSDNDNNNVENGDTYSVSFVAYSYVSSIITAYQSSYPVFLGTMTNIPNN